MTEDIINYGKLIDDAMHIIVKKALEDVIVKHGLPGQHHFFISFLTHFPGVTLSEKLRKKYPNEMTIVLQYQFDDLTVTEHNFSVVLSFDNEKECIVIPFASLTAFADPSVKFGLQFRYVEEDLEELNLPTTTSPITKDGNMTAVDTSSAPPKPAASDNVVTLDHFRKK